MADSHRPPRAEDGDISERAFREALDALVTSRAFAGSDRLLELLNHLAEETLAGRVGTLREAAIGNALYGREPPYDPRIDSTVRVEARRLRRKLAEYYAEEGRADPVIIGLPLGGYAITATRRDASPATRPSGEAAPIFERGPGARVAVMPFLALGDAEVVRFAAGLTDELMYAFGQAPGIHPTARGVGFQYRDRPVAPASLAAELGVDAVVHGTIRHEAGRFRIIIEVSDPGGFVVWTERFDAPDNEGMSLQERIAATIVSRAGLDSSLMRADQVRPRPAALAALGGVIRARQLLDTQTPAAIREAMAIFERVARAAPDYARGHSGIADCACDLYRMGLLGPEAARERANAAVFAALAIDPRSVEAHASKATVAAWLDFDRAAAEAGFEHALDLGGNARGARLHGVFLTVIERHEDAARLFRMARVLEPLSGQQDIAEAISDFEARRFGTLAGKGSEAVRSLPAEAQFYVALAGLELGESALAEELAPGLGDTLAARPDLVLAQAELEARLGRPARGRTLLRGRSRGGHFGRATLAMALGDPARAISELGRCVDRRELARCWIRFDARFDLLRGGALFAALLDRLAATLPGMNGGPRVTSGS